MSPGAVFAPQDPNGMDPLTCGFFTDACYMALRKCHEDRMRIKVLIEVGTVEVFRMIERYLVRYGADVYYKVKLVCRDQHAFSFDVRDTNGFDRMYPIRVPGGVPDADAVLQKNEH